MVVSSCKFLSILAFETQLIDIRMGDATFRATWDDNVGVVNLTEAELKEFTTSSGSDEGEHITSMLNKTPFSLVLCVLSGLRREILMETDDPVFKVILRFDICCMTSGERRVPQIEEDPCLLYYRSMFHISTSNWGII